MRKSIVKPLRTLIKNSKIYLISIKVYNHSKTVKGLERTDLSEK